MSLSSDVLFSTILHCPETAALQMANMLRGHVQVLSDICFLYFLFFFPSPLYLSCLHIWVSLLTDFTSISQGSLIERKQPMPPYREISVGSHYQIVFFCNTYVLAGHGHHLLHCVFFQGSLTRRGRNYIKQLEDFWKSPLGFCCNH